MMKKINRVIVYYDDGTYEEISHSVPHVQSEKNQKYVETSPVTPYYPMPYVLHRMNPLKNPWDPPFTVTCGSTNKYSITSMSSGNVDLPKS